MWYRCKINAIRCETDARPLRNQCETFFRDSDDDDNDNDNDNDHDIENENGNDNDNDSG